MNIAFVGLASNYTPHMSYQENLLTEQFIADGHQVTYLSDPAQFVDGKIIPTACEDTVQPNGMRLVRLPYCKIGPAALYRRLRKFKGVYSVLEQAQPDVIFCQNTQYWSILDVIRYKKEHPEVKLYADTHAGAYNSGTNWLSLHVLHRIYYRNLFQKLLPYLEKYFNISIMEKEFSIENYGAPESIMEFFPLGGMLPTQDVYQECRARRRKELGMEEDGILFFHSGKLSAVKCTAELLRAFAAVPDPKFRLAIAGSIPSDMESTLRPLIEADGRVIFLGWKSAEELQEYLCACDVYAQAGGVSVTVQNAICAGCAVLAYPYPAYLNDINYNNFLWAKTQAEMEQAFRSIAEGSVNLCELQENSRRCAREVLDYRKLAARLYQ